MKQQIRTVLLNRYRYVLFCILTYLVCVVLVGRSRAMGRTLGSVWISQDFFLSLLVS